MFDFDLKISNGTVANSAETFSAEIGVKDGKIIAIGKKLGDALKKERIETLKEKLLSN